MDRKHYKAQASAHRRAELARAKFNQAFACYGLTAAAEARRQEALALAPAVAAPAGFDRPSPDPLMLLAGRRDRLLASLRLDGAELARRAAERAENARLCITCVAEPIRTDGLIRAGMAARIERHLSALRGDPWPLSSLHMAERTVASCRAYLRMMQAEMGAAA